MCIRSCVQLAANSDGDRLSSQNYTAPSDVILVTVATKYIPDEKQINAWKESREAKNRENPVNFHGASWVSVDLHAHHELYPGDVVLVNRRELDNVPGCGDLWAGRVLGTSEGLPLDTSYQKYEGWPNFEFRAADGDEFAYEKNVTHNEYTGPGGPGGYKWFPKSCLE